MSELGDGLRFAVAAFAVWRVTHLLAEEDGPADAVVRLRERLGTTQLGELMDCFYCLSIWIAAPASLAAARTHREIPLTWLALSGAACLLERATCEMIAPAVEAVEWKGPANELLWQEAQSA